MDRVLVLRIVFRLWRRVLLPAALLLALLVPGATAATVEAPRLDDLGAETDAASQSPPNRDSILRLMNLSATEETTLSVTHFSAGGSIASQEPIVTLSPYVEPGAASTVSLKANSDLPGPFYGSSVISSDEPVGSVHLRRSKTVGGQFYAGDSGPTITSTRLFIPMVFSGYQVPNLSGLFHSRINLQNPSADSIACVWFSFWDVANRPRLADGLSPRPSPGSCPSGGYEVQAGATFERDLSTMTSRLGAPYAGSVMVLSYPNSTGSTIPVVADVEIWSADRFASFSAPPMLGRSDDRDGMGRSVTLPLVFRQWNGWNTYLHVQNSSWSDNTTLRLVFRGPGVPGGVSVFKTTLMRNRVLNLRAIVDSRLPPGFAGSLTIENIDRDDPITAVAFNYHQSGAETPLAVYAATPTDGAVSSVLLPLVYNNRGGTAPSNGWTTRIAVQTLDGSADSFNLSVLPETCCGARVGTFSTGSRGSRFVSFGGIDFSPPLANDFIGTAQLTSATGRPFTAVVTVDSNVIRGDAWAGYTPVKTESVPPADIATFYDYGSGSARIHTWLSAGDALEYKGPGGWWGVDRGYSLANVGGRMVTGDFDGDGRDDVATFYDYGANGSTIHVWTSKGSSFAYRGPAGWWGVESGYSLARVQDRVVAGDFNRDGRDDIAAFYDYGSGSAAIHVWLSTGTGFDYRGPSGWWNVDSGYSLANVEDRMVAGDFDGDGRDDVATFYGSGGARLHVWLSTGSSFNYRGPGGWWGVDSGYALANVEGRMVAGDFNADGRDDIATFYDYGSGSARLHVWLSTKTSFDYRGPSGWWGVDSGYSLSNVDGRMVSADFSGDGKDDVATFYDYGSGAARVHVWLSTATSFDYRGPAGWWGVDSGYSLSNVGARMVAGDFGP